MGCGALRHSWTRLADSEEGRELTQKNSGSKIYDFFVQKKKSWKIVWKLGREVFVDHLQILQKYGMGRSGLDGS